MKIQGNTFSISHFPFLIFHYFSFVIEDLVFTLRPQFLLKRDHLDIWSVTKKSVSSANDK